MERSGYKFLVAEDDLQVCDDIKNRMSVYPDWNCIGLFAGYDEAMNCILAHKPDLLFLDYSIRGGNTFDLLDVIANTPDYRPFIIYFTGYGSENTFISEEIVNRYRVNIFLNKPIQEKLTAHLAQYVQKATQWISTSQNEGVWITSIRKEKIRLIPKNILCISQSETNPRFKIIHLADGKQVEFRAGWHECEAIAAQHRIDYCFTNARYTLINKSFISKIQRPFVWLNDDQLKVEVTKERWKNLE
ncbi:MAG: hypothetical protein CFE23_14725 [Flavobacterium sp. BFFFF1]|uniref:LytR/AlgR family response regulator transcription factor n=1 Tax=unclassified Flavobacterium TaxID=196869 RepID=UPI000BCC0156|nr:MULTISPECIES: hypothetical protein [unclassified Flavobacterium]OYU79299.1 MAG: hypothetical protein CFE23_14725 [Flavobacterium sp. BFFFF1]